MERVLKCINNILCVAIAWAGLGSIIGSVINRSATQFLFAFCAFMLAWVLFEDKDSEKNR